MSFPSLPFGDAPCPACGTLLWFVALCSEVRYFDSHDERLISLIVERLVVTPDAVRAGKWDEFGFDSIALVELVMDLEEHLE